MVIQIVNIRCRLRLLICFTARGGLFQRELAWVSKRDFHHIQLRIVILLWRARQQRRRRYHRWNGPDIWFLVGVGPPAPKHHFERHHTGQLWRPLPRWLLFISDRFNLGKAKFPEQGALFFRDLYGIYKGHLGHSHRRLIILKSLTPLLNWLWVPFRGEIATWNMGILAVGQVRLYNKVIVVVYNWVDELWFVGRWTRLDIQSAFFGNALIPLIKGHLEGLRSLSRWHSILQLRRRTSQLSRVQIRLRRVALHNPRPKVRVTSWR